MNNPGGQTKILVTHALHIFPQVDYIYTIADGQIMERGTYFELIANDSVISRFVKEFGSTQQEEMEEDPDEAAGEVEVEEYEGNEGKGKGGHKAVATLREQYEKGGTIMQDEERNIYSVSWRVYKKYLFAGNGSYCSYVYARARTGSSGTVQLLACILARPTVQPTCGILRMWTASPFF